MAEFTEKILIAKKDKIIEELKLEKDQKAIRYVSCIEAILLYFLL